MNFTSQMLRLLVQNGTKYQQLCQGTWGHIRALTKGFVMSQTWVLCSSWLLCFKSGRENCNCALSERTKSYVCGRNSQGKRMKQMFLKPHNETSNANDTAPGRGFHTLPCERTRRGSFKMQIPNRQVCGGAWGSAFLTSATGCWCRWSQDHILNN